MDINDFREKYTEYDHVSDEALNKSLHEKYYADADYGEFTSRFLFGGNQPVEMEEGHLWGGAEEFSKAVHSGFLGIGKSVVGTIDWLIPGEQKALEQAKANISRTRDKYRSTHSGALAWSARVVGEAIPYMGAALAGAALAGAGAGAAGLSAKGVTAARTLGAFASGFTNMGDNAYDEAKASGATEGQANLERAVVGTITGAIESLQVTRIMKFAKSGKHSLGGFIRTVRNKAWKQAGKGIKSFTADVLKHSIEEGLEEFAQEGVALAVPATFRGVKPEKPDGTTDWWAVGERLGAATLGGFVAGGFLGSVMMGGNTYTPSQVKDTLIGEYKMDPAEAEGYAAEYAVKTAPEGVDQAKYLVDSLGMTQEQADAKVAEQGKMKKKQVSKVAESVLEPPGSVVSGFAHGKEVIAKIIPNVAKHKDSQIDVTILEGEGGKKRIILHTKDDTSFIDAGALFRIEDGSPVIENIANKETIKDAVPILRKVIQGEYGRIKIDKAAPRAKAQPPTAQQLPPKVKKLSRKEMRAIGHAVPKRLGFSEDERRMWQEQITGKRSMTDMTTPEMRDWVEFLQEHDQDYSVISEEDMKIPITVGGVATTMEAVMDGAASEVAAIKGKDVPDHVKKPKFTTAKKIFGKAVDIVAGKLHNPMFHLAEVLSPTHGRVIGDGLRQGRATQAGHKHGAYGMLKEKFEKAGITRADLANMSKSNSSAMVVVEAIKGALGKGVQVVPVKIGARTYDMTTSELITVYLWANQEDGMRHISKGGLVIEGQKGPVETGAISETDIEAMMSMVENDPKAMAIVDTFLSVGEELWTPSINTTSHKIERRDIATNPQWFGLIVKGMKKLAGKGIKYDINLIENKGILKDRTKSTAPLIVRDAFDMFDMFENAIAEYVGFAEPTRVMRTLLNNKGINTELEKKGLGSVHRQLTRLFNKAQGTNDIREPYGNFINMLLPNVYKAVLVTNPGVIVAQYMSVFNYGAFTDKKYMKHVLKGLTPKQIKFTLENNNVFWERYHMAHSNVALGEAMKTDQTLRMMTGKSRGLLNKLSIGLRTADIAALSGGMAVAQAEYADAHEGLVSGKAAEYWNGRDASFDVGSEDAQREINLRAEYLADMTQPSWNKWARSEWTSNPLTKMFFPFRSFHEKALTVVHRANLDYRRSDKTPADRGRQVAKIAYVTSGYMTNYLIKIAIMALLYGKIKEPHEIISGVVTSPGGMFPVMGRLLTNTIQQFTDVIVDESPGYRGEPIESMMTSILNDTLATVPMTAISVAHYLKGNEGKSEEAAKKALKEAYDNVGTMFGVPTNRMNRVYEGWFEEEKETKSKAKKRVYK